MESTKKRTKKRIADVIATEVVVIVTNHQILKYMIQKGLWQEAPR